MRVAFVLHSAKRDGAGKAAVELLAGLRDRGVEAFVLLPKAGPLAAELRPHARVVEVIPYRWWLDRDTPGWKKILRTLWNLLMVLPVSRAVRRWRCEVVYTNTLAVSVGALAAKVLHLPHVWHIHEFLGGETGFTFDLGAERSLSLVGRLSQVCVVVSDAVRSQWVGHIDPSRLRRVYQSVTPSMGDESTLASLRASRAEGFTCVLVGSLYPLKSQADAIQALAILVPQGARVHLWLVGEGDPDYSAHLHGLVEAAALQAHVRFFGFVENPFPVISAADALLSCLSHESCSRAIVEGMLAGKPVIAARGAGNSELVQDHFNGLLYEPHNSEALAACIRTLFENPELCRRMGENGSKWAGTRFTRERYAEEIQSILRSVKASDSAKAT